MSVIGENQNIQSNILAYEELQAYGFCRLQQEVDNTGGTMKLGSVLARTVAADHTTKGAWTELTATTITDGTYDDAGDGTSFEFAVIIGTNNKGEALDTDQDDVAVAADADVLLLVRGTAMVRREYLHYEGTIAEATTDVLVELIESYMEQVVVVDSANQFDGTYSDVTAISN